MANRVEMLANPKRSLNEDEANAVKSFLGALDVFIQDHEKASSTKVKVMPARYIKALLLVAEKEGLGVGDYAIRGGVSASVMSRHLNDIGGRDRRGNVGLEWVTSRVSPTSLRDKQVFLTDKGRMLIHSMARYWKK